MSRGEAVVATEHPRRMRRWIDALPTLDVTAYLTLWLVLLFGLSAFLVVGPLGAIGTPAALVMLPTALWWLAGRIVPPFSLDQGPQPVRVALLVYVWYMLASYVVAISRPLTELEANGSMRAALTIVGLCGVALIVCDGSQRMDRLVTLLRRLVYGAAFLALYGILQFVTGDQLDMSVPGLSWNHEPAGLGARAIFNRPSGTAMHPIEFSVVTAAALPLALHFVFFAHPGRQRQMAVAAAGLIALGIPLSISRSGFVVLAVAMWIMAAGWSWRRRANAALVGLAVIPALWMMIPGLVGTLRDLFTRAEADPSVQVRLERLPEIMSLVRARPWLGLGNGTWSVQDYFLIDNEIWVTTLETGYVGLGITAVLLVTAVLTGLWVRHQPGTTEETTHLARAAAAGIAGISVSLFTFDAFHYHILTGTLFLLIGATGALLRLTRTPAPPGSLEPPPR